MLQIQGTSYDIRQFIQLQMHLRVRQSIDASALQRPFNLVCRCGEVEIFRIVPLGKPPLRRDFQHHNGTFIKISRELMSVVDLFQLHAVVVDRAEGSYRPLAALDEL